MHGFVSLHPRMPLFGPALCPPAAPTAFSGFGAQAPATAATTGFGCVRAAPAAAAAAAAAACPWFDEGGLQRRCVLNSCQLPLNPSPHPVQVLRPCAEQWHVAVWRRRHHAGRHPLPLRGGRPVHGADIQLCAAAHHGRCCCGLTPDAAHPAGGAGPRGDHQPLWRAARANQGKSVGIGCCPCPPARLR